MTEPNEEASAYSAEELVNESFNLVRDTVENLFSVILGVDDIGVAEWVIVAVPTLPNAEGAMISVEPRIIPERFQSDWKTKGLLTDALDGLRRDDIAHANIELMLESADGDDEDE